MHTFRALNIRGDGAVVFAEIAAPPINLVGEALVADLVALIEMVEGDKRYRVVVFTSADPDFFLAHADITQVAAYRAAAAKLVGEASLGLLFRRLSEAKVVTIAQISGRVRGAGSELVLACDMRFASREKAIFGQMEAGVGLVPGAGAVQHLARLMGRGRALEVLLSADDYDAETAERYGWINRALPDDELATFVDRLARRISRFPSEGLLLTKMRVNEATLASAEELRKDSDLFAEGAKRPEAQKRLRTMLDRGMQTRGEFEMSFGRAMGEIED